MKIAIRSIFSFFHFALLLLAQFVHSGTCFLDSGCSEYIQSCFEKSATPVLDEVIVFLHKVLNS